MVISMMMVMTNWTSVSSANAERCYVLPVCCNTKEWQWYSTRMDRIKKMVMMIWTLLKWWDQWQGCWIINLNLMPFYPLNMSHCTATALGQTIFNFLKLVKFQLEGLLYIVLATHYLNLNNNFASSVFPMYPCSFFVISSARSSWGNHTQLRDRQELFTQPCAGATIDETHATHATNRCNHYRTGVQTHPTFESNFN